MGQLYYDLIQYKRWLFAYSIRLIYAVIVLYDARSDDVLSTSVVT